MFLLFFQVRQAAAEGNCCFGTIDTWLLYKLTKGVFGVWNSCKCPLNVINTLLTFCFFYLKLSVSMSAFRTPSYYRLLQCQFNWYFWLLSGWLHPMLFTLYHCIFLFHCCMTVSTDVLESASLLSGVFTPFNFPHSWRYWVSLLLYIPSENDSLTSWAEFHYLKVAI